MSTGRHSRENNGGPQPFTGDVTADAEITSRLARRGLYRVLARDAAGYGLAVALVVALLMVANLVAMLIPDDHQPPTVPTVIVLIALGVARGVASLIRPVPGAVRFVLGALPTVGLLLAALTATGNDDLALPYAPVALALAALVTWGVYAVVAGTKLRTHFNRRLAEIDAARPGRRTDPPVS